MSICRYFLFFRKIGIQMKTNFIVDNARVLSPILLRLLRHLHFGGGGDEDFGDAEGAAAVFEVGAAVGEFDEVGLVEQFDQLLADVDLAGGKLFGDLLGDHLHRTEAVAFLEEFPQDVAERFVSGGRRHPFGELAAHRAELLAGGAHRVVEVAAQGGDEPFDEVTDNAQRREREQRGQQDPRRPRGADRRRYRAQLRDGGVAHAQHRHRFRRGDGEPLRRF